jgi:CHAT domain-containing protein
MYGNFDISESFGFLDARWSVETGENLLESLGMLGGVAPSHVIVEDRAPDGSVDGRYLYPFEDVRDLLAAHPIPQSSDAIRIALGLDQEVGVVDVPVDAPLDAFDPAPKTYVVHDGGRILGFNEPAIGFRARGARGDGRAILQRAAPHSLIAEMPSAVDLGATVSLVVSMTNSRDEQPAIPIDLPEGSLVNIAVQTDSKLEVVGEPNQLMVVTNRKVSVEIELRAIAAGRASVRVLAAQEGIPLGRLTIRPTVSANLQADQQDRHVAQIEQLDLPTAKPSPPDLTIYVHREGEGANAKYWYWLNSTPDLKQNNKSYGPVGFDLDPEVYCRNLLVRIENLSEECRDDDEYELKLKGLGANLFGLLFPEDLRAVIWELRNSIATLVIQSDEPWIPWELCRLYGEDAQGDIVDGGFFCDAFAISRWLPGVSYPITLPLANMAYVVPVDSGLPGARKEATYLQGLRNRTVTRIDATTSAVHQGLAAGIYDGWHFSGHGTAQDADADDAEIILEDDVGFSPTQITGTVLNLRKGEPMVFLNACETIPGGSSLTGAGGWGNRFIDAGAGAFIGTYWSVGDSLAYEFCTHVYKCLLDDRVEIAEAVRAARRKIRKKEKSSATWLAYTLMAYPFASVSP